VWISAVLHKKSRGRQSQQQVVRVWKRIRPAEYFQSWADITGICPSRRINEILGRLTNHVSGNTTVRSHHQQFSSSIHKHAFIPVTHQTERCNFRGRPSDRIRSPRRRRWPSGQLSEVRIRRLSQI
jgi:hypothetical protein